MRKVTIRKKEYDDLVYPAIATATHNPEISEIRLNDKVLTTLEAQGRLLPKNDDEKRIDGMYGLNEEEAVFEFEDAECQYIVEKLKDLARTIFGRKMRTLLPIFRDLQREEE